MMGGTTGLRIWTRSHATPTGGNEAMLDGSGKWFKFRSTDYNMIQRTQNAPTFIW